MQWIEDFRKIAKERWEYLEHGNSRKGNVCFDKLKRISTEMYEKNQLQQLSVLLNDADDGVIFEAATKLLFAYPEQAIHALNKLSKRRGMISFCAEQTIRQWKAGKMKNPFEK